MLSFLVLVFPIGIIFADLITLRKDGNITCILTEEDTNSPVYLKPFSNKGVVAHTTKIQWADNDWMQTDSSVNHRFRPVINDSRWNDLPKFHPETHKFGRKAFNLTLSVCSVDPDLPFTIIFTYPRHFHEKPFEAKFNVPVPRDKSENCSWVDFTICHNHGSIALIGKYFEDIRPNLGTNPWFRFGQFPNYLVKQHFYSFLWSDVTSTAPSTLNVHFFRPGKVCVHFYVSIDEGSELQIDLKSDQETLYANKVNGFNLPGELRFWKYIKIEANFEGNSTKGTLYLSRQKKGLIRGYWAIDSIRYCQNNAAIYTAKLNSIEDQAICQILESNSVRPGILSNQTSVGCLGTNKCQIKCEDVLGSTYKNCEKHQICGRDLDDCYCSWGYKGDECKEVCAIGTWGMNCLYHCDENCNTCNPRNGTCEDIVVQAIWSSTTLQSSTDGNSEMNSTVSVNYISNTESTDSTSSSSSTSETTLHSIITTVVPKNLSYKTENVPEDDLYSNGSITSTPSSTSGTTLPPRAAVVPQNTPPKTENVPEDDQSHFFLILLSPLVLIIYLLFGSYLIRSVICFVPR